MAKIKVIYIDQTAGKVDASSLHDLIDKGKIAAFCGSHGWVDINQRGLPLVATESENPNERRHRHNTS